MGKAKNGKKAKKLAAPAPAKKKGKEVKVAAVKEKKAKKVAPPKKAPILKNVKKVAAPAVKAVPKKAEKLKTKESTHVAPVKAGKKEAVKKVAAPKLDKKQAKLDKAQEKLAEKEKLKAQKGAALGSKLSGKNDKKKIPEANAKKSGDLELDIFEDDDFEGAVEDFDPVALIEEEDVESKIMADLSTLSADFDWTEIRNTISKLEFFTVSEMDECHEKACENLQAVQGFCRLHYIKNWKGIKRKRGVLQEGKLQNYLEELVKKYPLEYIEEMLKDLKDEREFYKVLKDLNIDTNYNVDEGDVLEDDAEDIVVETRAIADTRTNIDDEESI